MQSFNKSDNLLGYLKILDASSHFDFHQDLDKRSLFITIQLANSFSSKLKQLIYNEVCRCIRGGRTIDSKLDPGMTIDVDFAQSRQLVITREQPHLHGLIILPCKVSTGGLSKLANAIDWKLEQLSFVKKSTTQVYQPDKSLGYTQDYAAKLAKILSRAANPLSDNGKIFPIDKVRSEGRRGSNMCKKWQRRADSLRSEFCWDSHLFFSKSYCQLFEAELAEISTVRLYEEVETFGKQNRSGINRERCGHLHMPEQIGRTGQIDQGLDRLPIHNFSNCQKWARDIAMRYRWIRANETNRGDASKWLIQRVSNFALRMGQEDKLHLIHKSTAERLPNVHVQDRSCWAIVMLLLASDDRELFTRSVRHRASKAVSSFMGETVPSFKSGRPNDECDGEPTRRAA